MTIASKFFYFHSRRRSPASSGREQSPAESPEPPDLPQHRRHPRHRISDSGVDIVSTRRGCGEHCASNISNIKSAPGWPSVSRRLDEPDKLPDSVQQARERLLRRLRGADVTETRDRTGLKTSLSGMNSFANASIRGPSEYPAGPSHALGLISRLMKDVFQGAEERGTTEIPSECPICLETFRDGDNLAQLSCGHAFHSACLEPWMQDHLDCPYCRASIVPATDAKRACS